ncbi:MAG: hypothetical protein GF383_12680 [Candidatus Lokiarchaeota archaeon]|nr:hypothetical protein [Candidatus Lokiarchaeota archaeon]MBD3341914.1 hypothetical protein [Candidatus Lokiarchaeota archaeon]
MNKNKAIGIIGSPRESGNSAILTKELLSNLNEFLNIESIFLKDYELNPCDECYYCAQNEGCSIDDDMFQLYEKLKSAEVIILSSPIFMGGITSRLRMFMERTWHLRKGQLKDKIGTYIIVGRRDIGSGANEMEEYLSRIKVRKLPGVLGFALKEGEISEDLEAFNNIQRLKNQIIDLL